jgi:hypothetical protein
LRGSAAWNSNSTKKRDFRGAGDILQRLSPW